MSKSITIDAEYCQAHGRCYAKFPDLFEPDDEGKATVPGDGVLPDSIRESEIAGICPEAAIILH